MKSFSKQNISDLGFNAALLLLLILVLIGLILIKRDTSTAIVLSPIVFIYALFVSVFRLSRIISASFSKYSFRALVPEDQADYEPSITFVIPCKNEEKSIRKTIINCFCAEYPKEKLEVIVINDGSTDGTISVLNDCKRDFENLKIVDWKINRGKREGMAEGFRMAKGEIIVQLDSDSYITPTSLRFLVQPFKNPEIGGVCAHADPENADTNWLTKIQAAYYFVSFKIQKAAESTFHIVLCLSGCCSAYRKDIVLPILDEFLSEKFLGLPITWGDDRSLTNWVIKSGYKTIYTEEAQAFTICPDDIRTFMKQQVRWKKGWFVNSILISKFLLFRHPFVAITYFFPLFAVSLLTPIVAVQALVYGPIMNGAGPWVYLTGIFLITLLTVCYYRFIDRSNKYWPYMFVWAAINMAVLSFVLFYALATIQNRKWGTR